MQKQFCSTFCDIVLGMAFFIIILTNFGDNITKVCDKQRKLQTDPQCKMLPREVRKSNEVTINYICAASKAALTLQGE